MKREFSKYQMITRVEDFLSTNVTSFPQHTAVSAVLTDIRPTREKLAFHLSNRLSISAMLRKCKILRAQSRESVTTLLANLSRTAAAIGVKILFDVPTRATEQQFINVGRALARECEPFKDQFVLHGMPSEFPENVNAAVNGLEIAVREENDARVACRNATNALKDTLNEAMNLVSRTEALVQNTLAGNSAILSAWEAARRVILSSSSKAAPEPSTETATVASP